MSSYAELTAPSGLTVRLSLDESNRNHITATILTNGSYVGLVGFWENPEDIHVSVPCGQAEQAKLHSDGASVYMNKPKEGA